MGEREMRKFILLGAVALGLIVAMMAGVNAQQNPFFIVQNPQGLHITAGTLFPSAATIGAAPADGAIHIDLNQGLTNPALYVYSYSSTAWIPFSPTGVGVGSVPSTLATNSVDVVNSVWGGTNQLIFEGNAADTGEFYLQWTNSATDVTITVPADNADWAGTGSFMISTLVTNAPEAANSVTGGNNQLIFEGATANAFELIITPGDVGQDLALTIDDYGVAAASLLPVLAATNVPQAANSIWVDPARGVVFEGAGVDAFEIEVTAADSTVGVDTYQFPNQGLAAATYEVHASPAARLATHTYLWPPFNEVATVAHTSDANDDLYCHRIYIPGRIAVGNIGVVLEDGGALAAADICSAAIYYDADAGGQVTTGTGDGTAAGLENIDVVDVTLNPNTYRICFCTSDATNMLFSAVAPAALDNDYEILLELAGNITWGVATNTCTAGVAPATTGALAGDDDEPIMFVLN